MKRAYPGPVEDSPRKSVARSAWTEEEIEALFDDEELCREGQWTTISQKLPGRSPEACRQQHKKWTTGRASKDRTQMRYEITV